MAVVALAYQQSTMTGITPTRNAITSAASNTYTFPNDGKVLLHFMKTEAVDANVTITSAGTADGLAIADVTVVVGASTGDVFAGPYKPIYLNDATGLITISSDNGDGLTLALIHLS